MDFSDLYNPVLKIAIAAVVGGIIGAEREYRNKSAGLKTIVLICIGSTLFTILSYQIGNYPDRIAANIITGIGFLGAGVIFKDEGRISGITTAATIWVTAALGMCIGIGDYALTAILIVAVLFVLLFFERLEDYIDKIHKVYHYTVLLPEGKLILSDLQQILKQTKLKVSDLKQFKLGDKTEFHITASGHPEWHQDFARQIRSHDDIENFTY